MEMENLSQRRCRAMPLLISLELSNRPVVVVGGGPVAERKVRTLLAAGAAVTVVSPSVTDGIAELHRQGSVALVARPYRDGDLAGAALAVAAAGVPAVDRAAAAEAARVGALVNVAANPSLGNVQFTAEVRRGPVTVGISTGGASPALAKRLRAVVEQAIRPAYGALAELLGEVRDQLSAMPAVTQDQRSRIYERIVDGPALDLLSRGEAGEARTVVQEAIRSVIGD